MKFRDQSPRDSLIRILIPIFAGILAALGAGSRQASAQIEGGAPGAVRDFNGRCGDTLVIYTHPTTASAQLLRIRITNTGDCDFRVQFGPARGSFQNQPNGPFHDEFNGTHDTDYRFNPSDIVRVLCNLGDGACSGQ